MAWPKCPAKLSAIFAGGLPLRQRQIGQRPDHDRHAQDHRAGAPQEHFGAVDQPQSQRRQGGPAVRRHLQHERGALALEHRGFKQARRCNGSDKPKNIQPQHRSRASSQEEAHQRPVRNERRDDQQVNRKPRRAGHERRDQNGGDAVALVLDGARRHDGRNRAGVGGKQRDEALALQADAGHGAVRDHRRARQIARIFQNADEQEQQQDLRQEHNHRSHAGPNALLHQRAQRRDWGSWTRSSVRSGQSRLASRP